MVAMIREKNGSQPSNDKRQAPQTVMIWKILRERWINANDQSKAGVAGEARPGKRSIIE
jgi:hypothetical protein